MPRMNPEYLVPDPFDRYHALLRQEPNEEEDEEEEDGKEDDRKEDDDDQQDGEGYSE